MIDLLAGANWQRTGKTSSSRPKPFPRPGASRRMGTVQRDPDVMRELLKQRRLGLVPTYAQPKSVPAMLRF